MIWRFDRWLRAIGWPTYDCQLCVGQNHWDGCYCAYYNAYAPCGPEPPAWVEVIRWLHGFLFFDLSPYWDCYDS